MSPERPDTEDIRRRAGAWATTRVEGARLICTDIPALLDYIDELESGE